MHVHVRCSKHKLALLLHNASVVLHLQISVNVYGTTHLCMLTSLFCKLVNQTMPNM